MNEDEYQRELLKIYEESRAVSYDYDHLYSMDEIKKVIEEF